MPAENASARWARPRCCPSRWWRSSCSTRSRPRSDTFARVVFTGENPVTTQSNSTPESAPTAVVLLSGGLDSTTVLAIASSEGFAIHALTFRYGQRHAAEIDAARRIAQRTGVRRHHIVDIDLTQFGGSGLTADIP